MPLRAIRQSALGFRRVQRAELPGGPSPYERLGTIHSGLDPLADIKRDLREVEAAIADLKERAADPGEAQKYAKTTLKLLIGKRADLLAMKKKWLEPGAAASSDDSRDHGLRAR
jgi:hypothetical protein